MGEKENNNNQNESPVIRWLRNAVLGATMADLPAMMTASGWRKDEKGDYVLDQQNDPHVKLLRDNLAAEGAGVMLDEFGIPAIYGLYNLGVRGLAKSGNNWARANVINKEMNNIIDEGLQYFGKVKYYGPTMGKTTAAKTNPDLADFDDVTREAKNNLAKELNIPTRVLQSDPKYALAYLEMLEKLLDSWRRNPLNTNKTLVISKKGLAGKNVYNNEPSIPDRQTFVQRLRNRGETDDANSNDWYNMLMKQNPNLRIDNRFVSEIEYNPHYIGFQPATQQSSKTSLRFYERPLSKLTEAERAGMPKGERNQSVNVKKTKLTKHLLGNDAVKMFKEYGGTPIPEGNINGWQLQLYVNEARERYGLVGRADITDQEIAEALYKHVNELGSNTAAKNIQGEPQLLFRGDTKNYEELKDRLTPDELALGTGTMDNSLGTLFLGEFPGSYIDKESAVGASRYLHGSYLDINGWLHRSSGTSNSTASNIPGYRMFLNNRGRRGNVMGFIKDASTEDSPNWLNAFIVRTPEVRNATSEISVLNDDNLRMGFNGATYKGTLYQYDPETYSMIESKTGKNLGEVVSEDVTLPEDRAVMADHYNEVLKDAENKKLGLLKSDNKSPLRHEHWAYSYFALPNFNKHNAKHILPFDLRIPRDWKDPNIFRLGVPLTIGLGYKYYNLNNDKN